MISYKPKRGAKRSNEGKSLSKGTLFWIAFAVFAGSILIGRWLGMHLLESRSGIKAPPSIEESGPGTGAVGNPPGAQYNAQSPTRQDISSPPLVIPPPVVEPKIKTSEEAGKSSADEETSSAPEDQSSPSSTIKPDEKSSAKKTAGQEKGTSPLSVTLYKVQTGIFSTVQNAEELVANLEKHDFTASFESVSRPDGSYYRVWVGPFSDRDEAEATSKRLTEEGYPAFVFEETGK